MTQDSFTLTFPMVMLGLLSLGGGILSFLVRKWLSDSEKSQDLKDRENHESFATLHARIDSERDKREALGEKMHEVQIQMATMVKREEMSQLYDRIETIHKDIITLLAGKQGA